MLVLKRVKDQKFLYRRGDAWVFRRTVPVNARAVFGQREVHVSLEATTLAEARIAMIPHLSAFEARLRAHGRTQFQTEPDLPDVEQVEAAVRSWFAENSKRRIRRGFDHDDAEAYRLNELHAYEDDVRSRKGGRTTSLTSTWIATSIVEAQGWSLDTNSPIYRQLLLTVARGQLEATMREREDLTGDPRSVGDPTFATEAYQRDAALAVSSPSVKIMDLFDGYAAERKPAASTVKTWRRQLKAFTEFIGYDDAAQVQTADVVAWKDHLLAVEGRNGLLSAKTVNSTYLSAIKTAFRWGVENSKVAANPAATVKARSPKPTVVRSKSLSDLEAEKILRGTLTAPPRRLSCERVLARRWVPWLCAYSGARVNEMSQLRREDVFKSDGIWVMRITPEAGSVKSRTARVVPIHSHIIEQGFIAAIDDKHGPLFYNPTRHRGGSEGNPQSKKVGEYLAAWVRSLGVDDTGVMPNHGWRHRFKTEARKAKIDAEIRDAIQGHVPRTEGEAYGDISPSVMLRELEKLQRFTFP